MVLTAENASLVPKWGICVITHEVSHYAEVKNALLYGDEVQWFAFEVMIREMLDFLYRGHKRGGFHEFEEPIPEPSVGTSPDSEMFFELLSASGLGTVVKRNLVKGWREKVLEVSKPELNAKLTGSLTFQEEFNICMDAFQTVWTSEFTEATRKSVIVISPGALGRL